MNNGRLQFFNLVKAMREAQREYFSTRSHEALQKARSLEVRFVRGVFAFLWNGNLDDEAPINAPTHEWAEVIGNIHDNPKLLKRKK